MAVRAAAWEEEEMVGTMETKAAMEGALVVVMAEAALAVGMEVVKVVSTVGQREGVVEMAVGETEKVGVVMEKEVVAKVTGVWVVATVGVERVRGVEVTVAMRAAPKAGERTVAAMVAAMVVEVMVEVEEADEVGG